MGEGVCIYETLIKVGWLIGLALGFLFSTCGFGAKSTLMLCSALNLASFALSLVLLKDPLFVFERSLVKIEKAVDFSYRGITLASKLLDGIRIKERRINQSVKQSIKHKTNTKTLPSLPKPWLKNRNDSASDSSTKSEVKGEVMLKIVVTGLILCAFGYD